MESNYKKIINYIVSKGDSLVLDSKNIPIKERALFFKEADLNIEKGLKEIVQTFGENHELFSEETYFKFKESKNLWVADPISGTQSFLNGLPHYCLVIAHLIDGKTNFACIYDPSVKELFTAFLGKGAFLNNQKIHVSNESLKVVVRGVTHYPDTQLVEKIIDKTSTSFLNVEKSYYSYAFDYCSVACGRTDGVISLTKDSFPEFAGSLIVREAGGLFTNKSGLIKLKESDRIFILGNQETYKKLFNIITDPHA